MKPSLPTFTKDGSHTLYAENVGEHYHSIHGAITEALHVYINAAIDSHPKAHLNVFEVGFGTGLNCMLAAEYARTHQRKINYYSIDNSILQPEELKRLNYASLRSGCESEFSVIVDAPWGNSVVINDYFNLKKIQADLTSYRHNQSYDVVLFDAFSPNRQPQLWTEAIFERLYAHASSGMLLTTYCAQGNIRRKLEHIGFIVERIPGPPGKREMIRARKP